MADNSESSMPAQPLPACAREYAACRVWSTGLAFAGRVWGEGWVAWLGYLLGFQRPPLGCGLQFWHQLELTPIGLQLESGQLQLDSNLTPTHFAGEVAPPNPQMIMKCASSRAPAQNVTNVGYGDRRSTDDRDPCPRPACEVPPTGMPPSATHNCCRACGPGARQKPLQRYIAAPLLLRAL